MANISIHLKRCHEQVLKEIEATKAEGEVAPEGINVVSYYVGGEEDYRFYYRLVATKPIFQGKNGKKTKVKHLGESSSLKAISAVDAVNRRKKIKSLKKVSVHIEKALHELKWIR
jgi:hypothetical protein